MLLIVALSGKLWPHNPEPGYSIPDSPITVHFVVVQLHESEMGCRLLSPACKGQARVGPVRIFGRTKLRN